MNQERFKIKRLGGRPGADKPGDAYAIMAPSFEPETGTKLPDSAFTIIVGTDRSEATRFCALLNNACELFENGVLQ